MVRSLTFVIATIGAAAVLTAQAPQQSPPAPAQPGAQQPATQQVQPPSPSTSASTTVGADKVTWSGCLKPGTAPGTWTLENAEIPAGTAVGTSGAAGAKRTFNLTPKASDNLTPHANHKIEVTGTVKLAIAPPAADAAAADAPAASIAPRQTLAIDSFKMVSATCP